MNDFQFNFQFFADQLRAEFDPGTFVSLDFPVQAMIIADCIRSEDSVAQYVANVGRGNVVVYAETLIAGFSTRGVGSEDADIIEAHAQHRQDLWDRARYLFDMPEGAS